MRSAGGHALPLRGAGWATRDPGQVVGVFSGVHLHLQACGLPTEARSASVPHHFFLSVDDPEPNML